MDKNSLYVSFFNALLGVGVSLLLTGNLMIGVLISLFLVTILWIERHWIYHTLFRGKPVFAVVGHLALLMAMIGVLSLLTKPNRELGVIVDRVNTYFGHLKPEAYSKAYSLLSASSKKIYAQDRFVRDHQRDRITVQDYHIDKVDLNEFDKNRATVEISSPFGLYGRPHLTLDLVKENSSWNLVMNPEMFFGKGGSLTGYQDLGEAPQKKKKQGKVSKFFRSVFH